MPKKYPKSLQLCLVACSCLVGCGCLLGVRKYLSESAFWYLAIWHILLATITAIEALPQIISAPYAIPLLYPVYLLMVWIGSMMGWVSGFCFQWVIIRKCVRNRIPELVSAIKGS